MTQVVYLNGEWHAATAAKISVNDRGFLFADGIYEVIPVYQQRPFLLDLHLQRLQRSAAAISLSLAPLETYQVLITELLQRNRVMDGLVYLQLTFGIDEHRQHLPSQPLTPTVYASVSPFNARWEVPTPFTVTLLDDIRWLRCDIKSTSLLGNIMLKRACQQRHADEPLLHRDGRITEGASCNYFFVRDGQLYTPPADHLILAGITRTWVIHLAKQLQIEVHETPLFTHELTAMDEVFLTSSSREIQPVGQIDDIMIGQGQCGPITAQLIGAYHTSKRHLIQE